MSRSQQSQVLSTATANSGADQTAATTAQKAETGAVSDYEAQLAKYAASNPFAEGGAYESAQDKSLSGVADAGSGAIANQEATIAKRTGENAGAPAAIAAETARANQRDLSVAEGTANQNRTAADADFGKGVVQAGEVPIQADQGMYSTSLGGANQALGTAGSAASTPGFWDTLGNSFASALGKTAGGGNLQMTKAL